MRILIISSFFPPQNSIASHRPYSWAKYWTLEGHDVTVLTTTKQQLPNDLNLNTSLFTILELPVRRPFSKANTIVSKVELSNSRKVSFKTRLLRILKKTYVLFCQKTGVFYACRYPDWHDIWAKDAIDLLKKDPLNWDLVISSGWPYSTHRIGLFLKENNFAKSWIVDWRDLWTKNHLYKGILLFHPYERHLEKKFHKNADYITTVSKGLAEQLEQVTNTPVKVIYNGYDQDDFEFLLKKQRVKNKKFTIAYLGSIYRGYQDPEPLFIALKELKEQGSINNKQLEVVFAGVNADVIDIARKYGVEDFYSFAGFIPREDALQMQYDADAVLFLEYNKPEVKGVLTGKLFEYLYIAREIWAIGTTQKNAAGEIIMKANAGVCFGKDVDLINTYLLQAIECKLKNLDFRREKNMNIINEYTRRLQAQKILSLFQ